MDNSPERKIIQQLPRPRTRMRLLPVVLILGACSSPEKSSATPRSRLALLSAADTTFDAAANVATFVLEARVLQRGASTVSVLLPGPTTATVVIGAVLRAPPENGAISGDTITVVFEDSSSVLPPGDRSVVLAYGLVLGRSIAVRHLKHLALGDSLDVPAVRVRLARADSANADKTMSQLAGFAAAVVLGRVDSVVKVVVPDSISATGGEHTMSWNRASVMILRALRPGDSSFVGKRVQVLFPAAASILAAAPAQLPVNESKILWLQAPSRLPASMLAGVKTTGFYLLLHESDTRPSGDSTLVAHALKPS